MRFRNRGSSVQVRLKDNGGYKWVLVHTGEIVDLPERVGLAYGLEKVEITKGKIGKKVVETKQYVSFWNDLIKIKGIGMEIAKDIVHVFKSEKEIKRAIKNKEKLPFRNDVAEKLRRKYGK